MLVTVPSQRATLTEIFAHPWMMKGGFTGPPSSHLPPRVPLRIEEIDREIIKGMVGFEFGSEVDIHGRLLDVLESELYINAVKAWDIKQGTIGGDGDPKVDRPSTRVDGKDMKGNRGSSKRFSGLGFYGKKIAGGLNAAFAGASMFPKGEELSEGSISSPGATLPNGLSPDTLDPTRGFHPLISIYYLVREKIEREQIWGPGVFASSTLSLTGPLLPPAPAQAYQSGSGILNNIEPAKPSAIHGPVSPVSPPSASTTASRAMMTPQPRQRATGEQYPQGPATAPRPSLRDPFAGDTRSLFQPPSQSAPVTPNPQIHPTSPTSYNTSEDSRSTPRKNIRSQSTVERSTSEDTPIGSPPQGSFARRFGSLLGRNPPSPDSALKGHRQRASIAGTSHKAGQKTAASILPLVEEVNSRNFNTRNDSDIPLSAPPEGQAVVRASTVGESSPSRHHRGSSVGTGPISLGRASGTTTSVASTRRQVSLGPNTVRPRTMMETSEFDERAEEELLQGSSGGDQNSSRLYPQVVPFVGRTAAPSHGTTEHAKPVGSKVYSVSQQLLPNLQLLYELI